MADTDELNVLEARFGDSYVQSVSEMKDSRIGAEAKRVMHIMRGDMGRYSQDLPDKLIDGCILRDANKLFDALTSETKPTLANALEIKESELTPYHLTAIVEVEAAGLMVNGLGIKSVGEYIQKNGFEDLIVFYLAVGNNLLKQLRV